MSIIVRLQGGLGNQLFQYALGKRMALFHKTDLKIDATIFENYPHHAYSISPFNVEESFATKEEVAPYQRFKTKDGRRWMIYNKLIADGRLYVRETQFNFDPRVFKSKKNAYFDGYWQTEKYFKDIEDIIRKEFTLKKPLSAKSQEVEKEILKTNAVALHVRRGLFASHPTFSAHHGTSSMDYYGNAVAHIASKVKNPHFFVFSDDQPWCKEHLKLPYPVTYVDHSTPATDFEDIILMSRCKHNILANSTFSWWGAWLNTNPNKIVTSPTHWFNSERGKKYNLIDLLPPGWLRF